MSTTWIAKHGRGFLPADDEALKIHKRMKSGECAAIKVIRVRDIKGHRRYWKLCAILAENCERIEILPDVWMRVMSKEDVHTAIKFCTGLCDTVFDSKGLPAAFIPKSTSFDEMTADEWLEYYPRVLDVVQHKILPGVDIESVQEEIMRLTGMAS